MIGALRVKTLDLSDDCFYSIYILGGFIDIRQNKSYITQYDAAPTDLNEMAGKEVDMSQSPHW